MAKPLRDSLPKPRIKHTVPLPSLQRPYVLVTSMMHRADFKTNIERFVWLFFSSINSKLVQTVQGLTEPC